MRLYALLSRLPRPFGYAGKILTVAFLAAAVPTSIDIWLEVEGVPSHVRLTVVLVAAVVAAVLLAFGLRALLQPVRLTTRFLNQYLRDRHVDDLPTEYSDEAGQLMRDAHDVVAELDRLLGELERASNVDPLTGVYNRRYCGKRLEGDLSRARRAKRPLSMAFFDLDGLKEINDTYGHLVGDESLRHLARTVIGHVREGDWVARWGGDEFVLLLWDATAEQAEQVFARVLRELRKPVNLGGVNLEVTATVGVCEAMADDDATSLLEKVDQKMMFAKRARPNPSSTPRAS